MADAGTATLDRTEDAFRHEALLYAGQGDFVDRTSSFIRGAIRSDEPILVAVSAEKIQMLRSELRGDADKVRFADMAELGRNPAQIIPAWQEFVAEHAGVGRRFRGVGEPIWAERSAEELVECQRHEILLNLAFAEAPACWLVCPYDTTSLEPTVIEEAARNHPFVVESGVRRESAHYRGLGAAVAPFDEPLPEPLDRPEEMTFEMARLGAVRGFASQNAEVLGLDPTRTAELVLAVNEVATNSLRHAGGSGVLRMWRGPGSLICEVRDRGRIEDPMVGRWRPDTDQTVGFGLWLVNALCDLVQVRSFPTGSVVRLHMALPGGRAARPIDGSQPVE